MEQLAFIITPGIEDSNLDTVNELIRTDWHVVHTCPMPSSTATAGASSHISKVNPTCLISYRKKFE